MLESYNLKKTVQELRQQLSHSLYQHDAACRVIARLTQERDRAVQQLANTQQTMANAIHDANTRQQQQAMQQPQQQKPEQQQQQQQQQQQSKNNTNTESKESEDIDMDGTSNRNSNNDNNNNDRSKSNTNKANGSSKDMNNGDFATISTKEISNHYPSNLWKAKELSKDVIDAITDNAQVLWLFISF